MRGGDTMWLQTIMGHERLETTKHYVKRGALQQVVLGKASSPMDEIRLQGRQVVSVNGASSRFNKFQTTPA